MADIMYIQKIESVKSNKSSDTRGVTESTVLGLTEKLKTLENPPTHLPMIFGLINDKAPLESPNFSGTINFEGCVYIGMAITVADMSAQLLNDFQVINDRLDNIEMDRGTNATRPEEEKLVAIMESTTNVIAKIDDHESRIINKSETNDPVFNIAGFGNGKTMNDIVAYYAPTTDLSSYVTTSHFESIYDGIDSRFDIVDATIQKNKNDLQNRITSVDNRVDARIQGNKNDLQNRITSVDNRFNLVDASIQGTTIYLEAFEKLAQGHTQQNTTQNIRLQQIDGEIKGLDGRIGTNTNTIGGMGNAITQIMRRWYSDDRLKKMKSSSKMLLQHCLN